MWVYFSMGTRISKALLRFKKIIFKKYNDNHWNCDDIIEKHWTLKTWTKGETQKNCHVIPDMKVEMKETVAEMMLRCENVASQHWWFSFRMKIFIHAFLHFIKGKLVNNRKIELYIFAACLGCHGNSPICE